MTVNSLQVKKKSKRLFLLSLMNLEQKQMQSPQVDSTSASIMTLTGLSVTLVETLQRRWVSNLSLMKREIPSMTSSILSVQTSLC